MKHTLFILLIILTGTCCAQDSCFNRQALDPLSITLNADSIHLLLKEYWQSFTGCPGPALSCNDMGGAEVSRKKLTGKVTVLNFWFTHCKPCVAEFEWLNRLGNDFKGAVNFVSFALDSKAVIDTFLNTHPLNWAVVPLAAQVSADFKIASYPTSIVLDKNWHVVQVITGGQADKGSLPNYDRLKALIEQALKQK